mgnify:CR=1 FL=1
MDRGRGVTAPAPVDLCLVLPHLGPGGAQKLALLAADHFIASGLRVQQRVGQARVGCLSIARQVRQKGLDVLIEAWARLPSISAGLMLTLVGDGPERGSLEAQAERCGVRSRIRFTGHCQDVSTELESAAIFVLPSRKEGMPNALLEAMAAGLAVIVTDASPGPLEVVDQGVNGLVVSSDDSSALAEALDRLAADPALRKRLGAAARHTLRQSDWPVVGPIWESLVDQL